MATMKIPKVMKNATSVDTSGARAAHMHQPG